MQTKLTLRLEERLIRRAKAYAKRSGKSLSQIVADFFALLAANVRDDEPEMSPRVKSLRGALRGSGVDEKDYKRHLEEKHL